MNDNPYQSPTAPPELLISAADVPLDEAPIVARYRWTAEELINGYAAHQQHIRRRGFRLAMIVLYALLVLSGIAWLLSAVGPTPSILASIAIFGFYLYFANRTVWKWRVRRQFRKRPDAGDDIEWRFTPDVIYGASSSSRSELMWSNFSKMVQAPFGVLLYPNPTIFHWIPRHAFESDLEYARFLQLAEARIASCRRIK